MLNWFARILLAATALAPMLGAAAINSFRIANTSQHFGMMVLNL